MKKNLIYIIFCIMMIACLDPQDNLQEDGGSIVQEKTLHLRTLHVDDVGINFDCPPYVANPSMMTITMHPDMDAALDFSGRNDMACSWMEHRNQTILHCRSHVTTTMHGYYENVTIVLNDNGHDLGALYEWKDMGYDAHGTCMGVYWITEIIEE